MKTYSVKEIADMLDTNPETVRRWIRSGKLVATQSSKKSGNAVDDKELYKFLQASSKYQKFAKTVLIASPELSLAASIGSLIPLIVAQKKMSDNKSNEQDYEVNSSDLKGMLRKNIDECNKIIAEKKKLIDQITEEIKKEEEKLRGYEFSLEQIDDMVADIKEEKNA